MKRGPFLLDTGFLVALINSADPDHAVCAQAWETVGGPLVTTEGVLVETAHLLRKRVGAFDVAWKLVKSVGTHIAAPTRPRFDRSLELMKTYADVPMDLVDALLVALAEETSITHVLTLDRRGFETYRLNGKRKFTFLP